MDYEKLHKDTITKLQEMVNSGKITVKIARGICADFVPESEDEKIRKEIISFVKDNTLTYTENGAKSQIRWLSWLEKQGEHEKELLQELDDKLNNVLENETPGSLKKFLDEQKPANKVEPKFRVGDRIKHKLTNDVYEIADIEISCGDVYYHLTNGGCVCENIDKFELVEQKPIDSTFEIKPKFKVGDTIRELETGNLFYVNSIEDFGYTLHYKNCNAKGCTTDFKYEDNYELVEQKPVEEINGEDYGIDGLYAAVDILSTTLGKVDGYQSDDGILAHKAAITAVKKLYKQKQGGQKHLHWLDELEGILQNATPAQLHDIQERYFNEATWKSSDEQIKAIRLARSFVVDDFCEHPTLSEILMELEEQLKKLK